MSDTIKKWHEMQEDREWEQKLKDKMIFESPDNGETVTVRPFGGDISERVVIKQPQKDLYGIKKEAYTLLTMYDERVIRMAAKILDVGE